MKRLIVYIAIILLAPLISQADDTQFFCGDKYIEKANLKLVYINTTFDVNWYELNKDSFQFGKYTSNRINYLFVKDEYYAKVISILGSDNITEVLRYLNSNLGSPYRNDKKVFGWMKGDTIILHRRFSLHLSQVEIYCIDMYLKKYDKKLDEIQDDNDNPLN